MTFSFGAQSTPAFGAQSSPSLFGASTPAFGAQPSPFNLTGSAPAFGVSQPASSPFGTGLFGAQPAESSSPAFSFPSASGGIFTASTSAFGTGGGGLFGQQQQQQQAPSTGGAFSFALVPQQQQQQQQQAQPQYYQCLITKDNKPLQHSTAWDDIHPESQKYLLELEKHILQYREDSRQVEACERLKDSRQLKQGLKDEEKVVKQLLQSLDNDLRVQGDAIQAFRERVLQLLRDTEVAVRAFQRSHKWREAAKVSQGQPLPPAVREQLSGAVVLPSAFLRESIPSLQESARQYAAMAAELERALPGAGSGGARAREAATPLDALPAAVSNLHATLLAVAARLERLHGAVSDAKDAHLARLAAEGDNSDLFAEAEERERRRSANAKRRYPASSTPAAAHHSAAPTGASSAPMLALGAPAAASQPAGGFFSDLAAEQAAPGRAPSPGLFGGAPAAGGGLFGGAPAGGLFGTSASSPAPLARQASVRKGKARK